MCINPSYVWVTRGPKAEKQPVACRQCWRCRKNRVDGYVGRALCEAAESAEVCTVTLTYAPRTDLADKLLHPAHFQLFIKRLRRAGHKVRYLVAGEYGDTRGRTHFHAILFFERLVPLAEQFPLYGSGIVPRYKADYPEGQSADDAPFCREIPQKRMVHIREWPHGHINADWSRSERAIRYVCKYILADDKNRAWFSLSKKPPIGAAWFARKAETAKSLGVLPSSFNYLPPGAERSRPYLLTGALRRDYLNAITVDPADKPKLSEWVRATFEKHERQRLLDVLNSQDPDTLLQLFLDRTADREEQTRMARLWKQLRENDELDALIARSCDNVLRRVGGRWVPNMEGSHYVSEKP